jgi:hypothetical protein
VDKKASTATGYGWLVWEKGRPARPQLVWIPPCRKILERDGDYQQAPHKPERRAFATIIPMCMADASDLFSR